MRIILSLFMVLAFLIPSVSNAQVKARAIKSDSGHDSIIMPELFSNSVLIDNDETPPIEPNIYKVKFLNLPPVNSVADRVDRLIQGIKKNIPPEYDHYGYEIRRYMAKTGNIEIFIDKEFLIEQIKNTKKALIIADYWKKHFNKEIIELEKIINNSDNIPFAARTAFKQNKVVVRSFLVDLKGWIEANNIMLSNIFKYSLDRYEVMYPEIIITAPIARSAFYNDLTSRQIELVKIREYRSFAMMVY